MIIDLQHRIIYLEEHIKTLELRIQNLEKITGLGPKEIESTPVPVKVEEIVTRPIHEDGFLGHVDEIPILKPVLPEIIIKD